MNTAQFSQRLGVWFLFGAFLVTFSQSAASPLPQRLDDESAGLFDYERSIGFDLKEESAKEQEGVTIRDVNYAATTQQRGRVKAYLVQPGGKGPFAGVLFFHWYGRPNGNRDQFLNEAVSLAKQGTTSLLIQGYFPFAVPPADANTLTGPKSSAMPFRRSRLLRSMARCA